MAPLALVLLVRGAGGDYAEAGLVAAAYGIAVAVGAPYGGPPGRPPRPACRAPSADDHLPDPLRARRRAGRGGRAAARDRGRRGRERADPRSGLVGGPDDLADRRGRGRGEHGVLPRRGAAGDDLGRRPAPRRDPRRRRPGCGGRRRRGDRRDRDVRLLPDSAGARGSPGGGSGTAPRSAPSRPSASARSRSSRSGSGSASARSRSRCPPSPTGRGTARSPGSGSRASPPARSTGGLIAGLRPARDERRRIVVGTFVLAALMLLPLAADLDRAR